VRPGLAHGSIPRRSGSRSPQAPAPPRLLPSHESARVREKIAGHAVCSHNRLMATRALFAFVFAGGFSAAWVAGACGNYVPPDVASDQGPANALQGKTLPGPPDEEGGSGVASSSGTGSSSGSSSGTGSSSGAPTGPFLCETQTPAGTIVDGGTCSVSFQTDIFLKMQQGGTWSCATAGTCHGGVQPPLMTTNTAAAFYTSLATFTIPNSNLPYVNPCSTNPADSQFACNVASTGTCGDLMPTTGAIPAADQTAVATWVACGAPFN